MTAPDEREFVVFDRGQVRDDIILASYRKALRNLINPQTKVVFTEDEIQRATQPGSRFHIEADAIDVYGQAMQARSLSLSDQLDPERANDEFLVQHHGRIWLGDDSLLAAVGSSGEVRALATPGTIYPGSPDIGDPTATVGTDANGFRFQVTTTKVVPASGEVDLPLRAIDVGADTNHPPDDLITWSENIPLGSENQAVILPQPGQPEVGFSGGFNEETSAEYAARILRFIANRPASGNSAHFENWAEESSSAVERGFVYPAALHAGSMLVAITEKRNLATLAGPLGRIPSAGTLADAKGFLTPPGSPVVPRPVFVVVTSVTPQSSDLIIRLTMSKGVEAGWFDATPFPDPPQPADPATTEVFDIDILTSQTEVEVTTALGLPDGVTLLQGADAPQMMVWDDGRSRFEQLDVQQVEDTGPTIKITLNSAPVKTLAIGDRISPFTDRLDVIGEAIEQFFDSLGPGQVVADTDTRAERTVRFPATEDEFPIRVTQQVASDVVEALGGVASAGELSNASRNVPDLPVNVTDGPSMVTVGKVNLYPL